MTEHDLQVSCIKLWDYELCRKYGQPAFALFAIPNGGARNPVVGAKLKAEGVRKGVADLFLSVPHIPGHDCHMGLYMELKVGKNRQTPEQVAFQDFVTKDQHYEYVVIRSLDEFARAVDLHLDPWINPDTYIYKDTPEVMAEWLRERFRKIHGFRYEDRRDNGW